MTDFSTTSTPSTNPGHSSLCREHWANALYHQETVISGHSLARIARLANGLHDILQILANSTLDAEARRINDDPDPWKRPLSPSFEDGLIGAAIELTHSLIEISERHQAGQHGRAAR